MMMGARAGGAFATPRQVCVTRPATEVQLAANCAELTDTGPAAAVARRRPGWLGRFRLRRQPVSLLALSTQAGLATASTSSSTPSSNFEAALSQGGAHGPVALDFGRVVNRPRPGRAARASGQLALI